MIDHPRSNPFWRRRLPWIAALLVLAVAATAVAIITPAHRTVQPPNPCPPISGAGLRIWQEGSTCVGVTDGSAPVDAAFNQLLGGRFEALFEAIRQENHKVETGGIDTDDGVTLCTNKSLKTVDVAVLSPWRSDLAGSRAYHQLEGAYVAQWQANHLRQPGGCDPLIRLLVADPGPKIEAWKPVVDQLLANQRLVAVVGLALSRTETIEAARELNRQDVPVVADLVTADGFDRTNFASAPPICRVKSDPNRRLDHFYRITYANAKYLDKIGEYLRSQGLLGDGTARQVTQQGYEVDAFACTNVQHVNDLIKPSTDPITFDLSNKSNDPLPQLTTKIGAICAAPDIQTVFYTARAVDLANVLHAAAETCLNRGLTVVAGTDATRLLTPEIDPAQELQRKHALEILRQGRIRLFFPATSSPAQLTGTKGYDDFRAAFAGAFAHVPHNELFPFVDTEIADTWMVNAHDAFFTAANAVHALSTNHQPYDRKAVMTNLSVVKIANAAQGDLSFNTDGTRNGQPTVLRLCVDGETPWTLAATIGHPAVCPSDPPVKAVAGG